MGVVVREKDKGSGTYWVFVNHNGRRTSKRVGSKSAAKKVARQIEVELSSGDFKQKPSRTPRLTDYFSQHLRTYLQTAVKRSTRDSYEANYRVHILPVLGKLPLNRITRRRVKDLIAALVEKGLSRASIGIITRELSAVLNHAIEDKIIKENPASRMSRYFKQAPVKHPEIQPLIPNEVVLFLEKAYQLHRRYYPLFLTAIHTGMRLGELLGMQWGDVDFHGRFITVRRGIVRGRVTSTKTDKTRRVDISDSLLATLRELRKQRKEEWLRRGKTQIPEWVFCNVAGTPLDPYNLKQRHFFKCLEQAGLRRIRFHDLRHTFASLLLQNGESLAYVKDQLGHSSIKMTVDVYGHLVPGANRQAVNRLPSLDSSTGSAANVSGNQG